jgi:hypothetical protein
MRRLFLAAVAALLLSAGGAAAQISGTPANCRTSPPPASHSLKKPMPARRSFRKKGISMKSGNPLRMTKRSLIACRPLPPLGEARQPG